MGGVAVGVAVAVGVGVGVAVGVAVAVAVGVVVVVAVAVAVAVGVGVAVAECKPVNADEWDDPATWDATTEDVRATRCPGSGMAVEVVGDTTRWAACPVCHEPVTPERVTVKAWGAETIRRFDRTPIHEAPR